MSIGVVGIILIVVDLWEKRYKRELDPRFEHVYAVLFYPEEMSWAKGERSPEKNIPRYKAVVNTKAKKSFWMLEYAIDLLKRGRIQYVTDTWKGEEEFKKWFQSKGITPPEKPATASDLLAITELKKRVENEQPLKEKSSIVETKTELLQTLHFFPEHWETYKKLIESKKLESPQSGEIKWCSDQIKTAIVRTRMLNLNEINAVIPQIEVISNDMALFGVAIQKFPRHIAFWFGDGKDVILNLISRGDVLYEKVKQIISVVEQTFR
jgi:hypothetical protein